MRMCCPAVLQPLHRCEIDQKHDEIEEPDVVAVRVEPKG
jgi:hypothetical protein